MPGNTLIEVVETHDGELLNKLLKDASRLRDEIQNDFPAMRRAVELNKGALGRRIAHAILVSKYRDIQTTKIPQDIIDGLQQGISSAVLFEHPTPPTKVKQGNEDNQALAAPPLEFIVTHEMNDTAQSAYRDLRRFGSFASASNKESLRSWVMRKLMCS